MIPESLPKVNSKIKAKEDRFEDCCGTSTKIATKDQEYVIVFVGYSGAHYRNDNGTLSIYHPKFFDKL